MASQGAYADVASGLAPEDELRAQVYLLLARFLARAPNQSDLELAAGLIGDESDLGRAIETFSALSANSDPSQIAEEYHDLFIGVGRGELLPYGSYYLTGFLNEKPLASLRSDMRRFGIARRPDVAEPEDHIASVLEMMAGLIRGAFGVPATLEQQHTFYQEHVGSWAKHFFADLEGAKSSVLYASVGTIGRRFLDIEETAFAMS